MDNNSLRHPVIAILSQRAMFASSWLLVIPFHFTVMQRVSHLLRHTGKFKPQLRVERDSVRDIVIDKDALRDELT
jgi:hypothetical protein